MNIDKEAYLKATKDILNAFGMDNKCIYLCKAKAVKDFEYGGEGRFILSVTPNGKQLRDLEKYSFYRIQDAVKSVFNDDGLFNASIFIKTARNTADVVINIYFDIEVYRLHGDS